MPLPCVHGPVVTIVLDTGTVPRLSCLVKVFFVIDLYQVVTYCLVCFLTLPVGCPQSGWVFRSSTYRARTFGSKLPSEKVRLHFTPSTAEYSVVEFLMNSTNHAWGDSTSFLSYAERVQNDPSTCFYPWALNCCSFTMPHTWMCSGSSKH